MELSFIVSKKAFHFFLYIRTFQARKIEKNTLKCFFYISGNGTLKPEA